jgi:hypothetical protein
VRMHAGVKDLSCSKASLPQGILISASYVGVTLGPQLLPSLTRLAETTFEIRRVGLHPVSRTPSFLLWVIFGLGYDPGRCPLYPDEQTSPGANVRSV